MEVSSTDKDLTLSEPSLSRVSKMVQLLISLNSTTELTLSNITDNSKEMLSTEPGLSKE